MSREKILFDFNWKYYHGDLPPYSETDDGGLAKTRAHQFGAASEQMNDAGWTDISLPHDFVLKNNYLYSNEKFKDSTAIPAMESIDNQLVASGSLPGSVAWYRKEFYISEEDVNRCISLLFDGVYQRCTIYLNNYFIGKHEGGFTNFCVEISDFVNIGGKNNLAIRVDARPQEGWWYNGGGIYRHVWLVKTNRIHIDLDSTFVKSKYEVTERNTKGLINIETCIENTDIADIDCEIRVSIVDNENNIVTTDSSNCKMMQSSTYKHIFDFSIDNPKLWSIDTPNLYKVIVEIVKSQEKIDSVEINFGIRNIKFDADNGFFLNGKSLKIKGVCAHQDHAGVGVALTDRILEFRLQKIKEMGCNAYRCAHNMQSVELLDICDRIGLLVMEENRLFSSAKRDVDNLKNMIIRDRNHPCIILWSLGNEETGIQSRLESARILKTLMREVKNLDDTRYITSANCF